MNNFILVPIGSFEQHGPHLPPNTDYLIAKKIAQTVSQIFKIQIGKGIKISISLEHDGFKNTMSISQEEFIAQVENILANFQNNIKFIFINAHGGNVGALNLIQELKGNKMLILNTFSLIEKDLITLRTSDIGGICHAGEFETSIMLYLFPEKVKMNHLKESDVKYVPSLDPNYKNKKLTNWKTINLSKSGVLGDPFHATSIKGKLWFNCLIKRIESSIEEFIT